MNYAIAIKRPDGRPPLSAQNFDGLLAADPSLTRKDSGIVWTQESRELFLNVEADHFWTDVLSKRIKKDISGLEKLRSIATHLDDSLFGEEGEELSTEEEITDSPSALSAIGGMILSVITLPFVILLFVVRIPWILWTLKKRLKRVIAQHLHERGPAFPLARQSPPFTLTIRQEDQN
jgi:hypothetical protein